MNSAVTHPGDGVHILEVQGELDVVTAGGLYVRARRALASHARVLLLDLAGLSFCDASGLSAFVRIANDADAAGCRYALVAPRPQVAKILRITGLDNRLAVFAAAALCPAGAGLTAEVPLTTAAAARNPDDGEAAAASARARARADRALALATGADARAKRYSRQGPGLLSETAARLAAIHRGSQRRHIAAAQLNAACADRLRQSPDGRGLGPRAGQFADVLVDTLLSGDIPAGRDGLPAMLLPGGDQALIRQAAGMVAAQSGLDVPDALALIHARAFADSQPAATIAAQIVSRQLHLTLHG